MPTFVPIKGGEDFFDILEEMMSQADEAVQSWQTKLKKGDYYLQVMRIYGDTIYIFGKILKNYREPRMRNYRLVRAFSFVVPEGELGDVHVSSVTSKISSQTFEQGKRCGWDINKIENLEIIK